MYSTPQQIQDYVFTELSNTFSVFSAVRKINLKTASPLVMFTKEAVLISSSFRGSLEIGIEFTTPLDYNVFKSEDDVSRNLFVGSGNVSTNFVDPDFTIQAGTIAGATSTGDKISFLIRRDISEDNLVTIIQDADTEIDSYAYSLRKISVSSLIGPVFGTIPNVPRDIQLASVMWTVAFMIERRRIQQVNEVGDNPYHVILKNSARKKIRQAASRLTQQKPALADVSMPSGGQEASDALTDLSSECGITTFGDCDGC